jgi:HEAT repeat protein
MGAEICFDDYLESVKSAYQQWWRLYTLTDATGRESQGVESDRPAFFDFGLMVQTVEPPKAEQERESEQDREKKEKIERLPVLEGICKYAAEHVLLVGRPGSGKSTALARLLLQEAENALEDKQAKIPVLVELRYLPSEANESSVCDRILAFIHKHDPALDIDEAGIKQLLRQGRLLLLVDGVNELPSDRGRVMVNQFRELYQKTCPMIFTTRELSAGGDLGVEKRLEMQPLTEPQMQQFVMAYLPTQGERLLRQLSGRLREFGQTPLLLWMLCELFQQSEQIPENLGKVFQVFTQTYENSSVRNHEVAAFKNNVQPLSDRRIWKDALKHLASKMMQGNSPIDFRTVISKDEIIQEFKLLFKDELQPPKLARDCLDDLLDYHLIQIRNEDKVEFRHQLIQEYYAAEWLLGLLPSLSDARLQQGYLNYLKWTEPLALMLELVEGEEQAVRVVRLALDVDLRLGARLAGAVKYGFQEKTVGLLLREIEERKIPQLYAIDLLGESRSDVAIELLIAALKDADPNVGKRAAKVLGKIGSDKAIEHLIVAFKDADHEVQIEAANALGKIGSDKAIEHLIQFLKKNNLGTYSMLIVEVEYALVEIGSDKAIESIIQERPNIDDLLFADMLGKISSDKAIEPLIQALKNPDSESRWVAARALRKTSNDKAVEPLIKALNDSASDVREKAAEALGKIGSSKAIEPLIEVLKDPEFEVRNIAAEALGKIGSDKAVESLIEVLKNLDYFYAEYIDTLDESIPTMSRNIAKALGEIGSDKALEPLIHILKESNYDVRWTAAEALGEIGCDKAVEPLIQILKDQEQYKLWLIAAEALGKIGNDQAVEPLIEVLRSWDVGLRANAERALGKIGNDKAVQILTQVLLKSNPYERWISAEALGGIGSDKAIEPLIQVLNDPILSDRRSQYINMLGIYLPWDLEHTSFWFNVREKAAEALGGICSDKVVEPLIQALKDSDNDVRWRAAEALVKIAGSIRNLPTLTQQLPHLLTLIPTEASQQALSVITAIQSRCKYYNYDIAQTPLPPEDNPNPTTGNTYIFKAPVGQVVENLTVQRDNIATQNNQKTAPES